MLTWGSLDILLLSWFVPQMQGLELWAAKNLYSCPVELFVMRDVLYLLSNTVSTSHTLLLEMWLV